MRKIALIGQSHAVAVLDAIADWRPQLALLDGETHDNFSESFRGWFTVNTGGRMFRLVPRPGFEAFAGMAVCLLNRATFHGELATIRKVDGGRVHIGVSDVLSTFIEQVRGCDTLISIIYGNEQSDMALTSSLPEYDFAPFDEPAAGQPIDRIHIANVMSQFGSLVTAPLACLRSALPAAKILHIAPPPPLLDPGIAARLEGFGAEVSSGKLARPSLRRKIHRTYIDVLRAQLERLQVRVVEPDYDAVCEDGYLRPAFADGLTHGNRAYGERMAMRIAQLIEADA